MKDEDLPKDTLGLYDLEQGRLEKIPRMKNFAVPEKWSGWLFYQIETEKPIPFPKDTATTAKQDTSKSVKPAKPNGAKTAKKPKKEDKDNGYRLIVRHTASGGQDTIAYVKDYVLAKRFGRVLLQATGKGDTLTFPANPKIVQNGVYQLDLQRNLIISTLALGKESLRNSPWMSKGSKLAFLLDADTTKARIRPWVLCYRALSKAGFNQRYCNQSKWIYCGKKWKRQPGGWTISENATARIFRRWFQALFRHCTIARAERHHLVARRNRERRSVGLDRKPDIYAAKSAPGERKKAQLSSGMAYSKKQVCATGFSRNS